MVVTTPPVPPTNPFHTIVREEAIAWTFILVDSGPTSKPIHPAGMPSLAVTTFVWRVIAISNGVRKKEKKTTYICIFVKFVCYDEINGQYHINSLGFSFSHQFLNNRCSILVIQRLSNLVRAPCTVNAVNRALIRIITTSVPWSCLMKVKAIPPQIIILLTLLRRLLISCILSCTFALH